MSGTTNKTRYYTKDPYYKKLLDYFQDNLLNSEFLVVIGYGFNDGGINKYLEDSFLSKGKHMVVIDPYKPKNEFIDKYKATYIPKGVTQVTYKEYLDIIPTGLRPKNE